MESPHTSNSLSGNAKMDVLEDLSQDTAFLILDFAMKFLTQRYHNSMVKWFGKAGMVIHVACVIVKDHQENLKKRHIWYSLVVHLKILSSK